MHPWHDSYVDDALVEAAFPVIIALDLYRQLRRGEIRK